MYPHHAQGIENTREYFEKDPGVLALLLGGSIAHGFASPASDVDVMIIVAEQEYQTRLAERRFQFFSRELCAYEGGYVDGKYLGPSFLTKVAESGSEPARFAFADARVLFSRVDELPDLVQSIGRYPVAEKANRIQRFYAQFEAWSWYATEALRLGNSYLLGISVSKLALFGGRLILAHNELLYPYHKWFLRVLSQAADKPSELMPRMEALLTESTSENIRVFCELIKQFRDWGTPATAWPNQFMVDSELNWLNGATPIDDL